MMRRVSSRQRLVSWDAFDATAMTTTATSPDHEEDDVHSDDEDDYATCYGGSHCDLASLVLPHSHAHQLHPLRRSSLRGGGGGAGPLSPSSSSAPFPEYSSSSSSSKSWLIEGGGDEQQAKHHATNTIKVVKTTSSTTMSGKKRDRRGSVSTSSSAVSPSGSMKKTVSFSNLLVTVPPPPSPSSPPCASPSAHLHRSRQTAPHVVPVLGGGDLAAPATLSVGGGTRAHQNGTAYCSYMTPYSSTTDMLSLLGDAIHVSSVLPSSASLSTLSDDVTSLIASHLTPSDVRRWSSCSASFRQRLLPHFHNSTARRSNSRGGEEDLGHASSLWTNLCFDAWPILSRAINSNSAAASARSPHSHKKRIEFKDDLRLPTAGAVRASEGEQEVNLSLLLGLSNDGMSSQPTRIDRSHFVPVRRPSFLLTQQQQGQTQQQWKPEFRTLSMRTTTHATATSTAGGKAVETTVVEAVQYTGPVNVGDRCIRSDLPFPSGCSSSEFAELMKRRHQSMAIMSGMGCGGFIRSHWPSPPTVSVPRPAELLHKLLRRGASASPLLTVDDSSVSSSSVEESDVSDLLMPQLGAVEDLARRSFSSHEVLDEEEEKYGEVVTPSPSTVTLRPFVMPFVSSTKKAKTEGKTKDDDAVVVNVTPRLVAYYEVTILPRDKSQEPPRTASETESASTTMTAATATRRTRHQPLQMVGFVDDSDSDSDSDDDDENDDDDANEAAGARGDCVALGLSTSSFQTRRKMPGWDDHSYGYHGDDGGIFHSSGEMVRRYGPTFGVGDTVGCGLDYINRSIFFTVNGQFLGYAWTGLDEVMVHGGLYPTVGVDTRCPLVCNFGSSEFAFDLDAYVGRWKHHRTATIGALSSLLMPSRQRQGRSGEGCAKGDEDDGALATATTTKPDIAQKTEIAAGSSSSYFSLVASDDDNDQDSLDSSPGACPTLKRKLQRMRRSPFVIKSA